MAGSPQAEGALRKDLTLFGVFAVATGTTLSAGFFLLPGLAFAQSGPAVVLAYSIAALMMIAPMLCKVELATAMPKAGGTYFFLDRSLGPLAGTIGGLGTWLALTLKASFSLVGMGAYISLFFADTPITWLALGLAVFFGFLNLLGTKATTRFQNILVISLLVLLAWFLLQGSFSIDFSRFNHFFEKGTTDILATAGLVFISYVGVSKVPSLAEEIENPQRNLPLGVFLGLGVAFVVYILGITVIVGVTPAAELSGSYTPLADAAASFAGPVGLVLISIAALFAFTSAANAGILSSSRYPLAMSRDDLIPSVFRKISPGGVPTVSLLVTVLAVIFYITAFDVLSIAKLASAFQLALFALICLAVIVMRESAIDSYDPTYKTPLYPWVPLAGIFGSCWLITQMGTMPTLFAVGLVVIGVVWYFAYANRRVQREGAIYHVFERLGQRRFDGLDSELRGILKERSVQANDPFDEIVATCSVLDVPVGGTFEPIAREACAHLETSTDLDANLLVTGFMNGVRIGATPIAGGVALPHLRVGGIDRPHLVVVRSRSGVLINVGAVMGSDSTHTVQAMFFLLSPTSEPTGHLRLLAQLAACVEQDQFMESWLEAAGPEELRETLLQDERHFTLFLTEGAPSEALIGEKIRNLGFPSGCLVAIIRRGASTLIPRADMVLEAGDRLTVIGEVDGIASLMERFELERSRRPSGPN